MKEFISQREQIFHLRVALNEKGCNYYHIKVVSIGDVTSPLIYNSVFKTL